MGSVALLTLSDSCPRWAGTPSTQGCVPRAGCPSATQRGELCWVLGETRACTEPHGGLAPTSWPLWGGTQWVLPSSGVFITGNHGGGAGGADLGAVSPGREGGTWHRTALGSEIAADTQFITAAATQGNCCRNPLAPQGEWGRGLHGLWVARRRQGHHWHPPGGKGGKPRGRAHSCPRGSAPCPPGVGGARCVSRRPAASMLQGTGCGDVTCVSG